MSTLSGLQLGPSASFESELTLRDLWSMFRRRRKAILTSSLVFLLLGVLYCALVTPQYTATTVVEIQKASNDSLNLDSMTNSTAEADDAISANIAMQTEASVLESDTIALRVVEKLDLEHTADFKPHFNPIGAVLGPVLSLFAPKTTGDAPSVDLEHAPNRMAHAIATFRANLVVKPIAGSRLLSISYKSRDPKLAAAVVNQLVASLTEFNFQTRYDATAQASDWLSKQLSSLRKRSEDLQAQVTELQRESGVLFFPGQGSSDDKGSGSSGQDYSSLLDRLQRSNAAYSEAQESRIQKGALLDVVRSGNPELISGLLGSSSAAGASAGVSSSLNLIQNLRLQEATAQAQLDQMAAKFGPGYPKLEELRSTVISLQTAMHAEVERIGERVANDYLVAEKVEAASKLTFDTQKQAAQALDNKAIEYALVRQEAEQSRTLYENLLSRLTQAGVLSGLRSTNVTIVDPGRVPSKPSSPKVLLVLGAATFAGLVLGACGALLADAMNNSIQNIETLESSIGVTSLCVLPALTRGRRSALGRLAPGGFASIAARDPLPPQLEAPQSPYVEALRHLRTSLLLARSGAPPQVILVTSSIPGEGKTTLSMNLAALLAQQGKRVLLVDADMRKPMLQKLVGGAPAPGLSGILSGQIGGQSLLSQVRPFPGIVQLDCLFSGEIPPYPAELLASPTMQHTLTELRRKYDFILLDSAPVLPVTDATVLSSMADATLLVGRYDFTKRQSLVRSMNILRAQGGGRAIVVLNAVEPKAVDFHAFYGYSDVLYPKRDRRELHDAL